MQPINISRVILAGLLCGLIINIGEAVLNAGILAGQWAAAAKALNKPPAFSTNQIALFNVWGFAAGITTMWIYAAIRPRFGTGPKTAARAGVLAWFTMWALGSVGFVISDWMPLGMWAASTVWALVEVTLAALAGARIYRE